MLYRIRYRTRYVMTRPSISNIRKTFDVVYDINMRYRTFYVRYRRDETSVSTTLFMTFDIEKVCDLRYRIMITSISISTYDIEGTKRRYRMSIRYLSLRYRMLRSISNLKVRHSISGWQGSRCHTTSHEESFSACYQLCHLLISHSNHSLLFTHKGGQTSHRLGPGTPRLLGVYATVPAKSPSSRLTERRCESFGGMEIGAMRLSDASRGGSAQLKSHTGHR
jgi:hypothetical protein